MTEVHYLTQQQPSEIFAEQPSKNIGERLFYIHVFSMISLFHAAKHIEEDKLCSWKLAWSSKMLTTLSSQYQQWKLKVTSTNKKHMDGNRHYLDLQYLIRERSVSR